MTTETSTNGYPVLFENRTTGPYPRLRKVVIPGCRRHFFIRDGSVSMVLAHMLLWFHERVEPLDQGQWDDWGWAVRPVRGQTEGFSNHASGTAVDANATEHPMGVSIERTFSKGEIARIRLRVLLYRGCIVWGGEWKRADGMHFEIAKRLGIVERLARRLMRTPRGKRILDANPGLGRVIMS